VYIAIGTRSIDKLQVTADSKTARHVNPAEQVEDDSTRTAASTAAINTTIQGRPAAGAYSAPSRSHEAIWFLPDGRGGGTGAEDGAVAMLPATKVRKGGSLPPAR